jgi:parallel beta-helix repeat protein
LASDPATGTVEPSAGAYPGIGLTTLVSGSFASYFPPDPRTNSQNVVADHGATPSNSAFDNKAAFQAAINACGPGDEVYIPNGTYHFLTGLMTLKSGVNIRGQSKAGVILRYKVPSTTQYLFRANQGSTDIRLTDFTVDRDAASAGVIDTILQLGQGSSGSTSYTVCQRIYVARVNLSKHQRFAIVLENVKWGFVWDSDLHSALAFGGGGSGYGITTTGPKTEECWIVGNRIGLGGVGASIRHGLIIQYLAHNCLLEENVLRGHVQDAIDFHGEDEHHNEVRLNEVYDGVRIDPASGALTYPAGIGVGEVGTGAPAEHDNTGPYNWIHHNIVDGSGAAGYHAGLRLNGGFTNPTTDTIVENNTFIGGLDYGIRLGDLKSALRTQIKYNTISGNTTGIQLVEADDTTIANNHSHDNTTNLSVTAAADRYTIANNCFRRGTVSRPAPGAGSTYTNNAEGNVIDPPALPPPDPYFPGGHLAGGVTYIG